MADERRYPYVHLDVGDADEVDELSALLWDLGAQGIEERDDSTMNLGDASGKVTLVASFEDEGQARKVARRLPKRLRPRVEFVVGDAWADEWRRFFHPTRIAQRLVVRPTWEDTVLTEGEVELRIDPGRAFGSGIHETTRLCLREIDRHVRGGEKVLDVGCGSGILSVAAVLLGADSARAVDVDPDAVAVTEENARENGVSGRIKVSTTDVSRLRGEYDLVVANIQAHILIPMARALAARVRRGGTLVLSGILEPQREDVVRAYDFLRLAVVTRENEWVAIRLERR